MDPEPILEPEPEYAPAPMEEQSFGGASSNTNTYELDGANSTDRPASPSRVVQDRKLNSDAVPGYGRAGGSLSTKAAASKPRATAEETYAADVSAVGRSFESTVQLVPGVVTRTRTAHPPRPTGAIGTQVSLGTENVVFTGGIDRTRVDGGHWTHVPAELAIRTQGVAIDAGYRYQRLTAPVQTATDRRRHAVDFATLFITNTVAVALDGLVQDLGCEGCDGTRAMAFGAGFRKRFESGPLRWSLGAGGAFSDFRGATPAQGDRTAIAVGPQFELSWVPRGFLGHLAVAGDVANPAGLQFVPTATGRLGPQLGQVWFGVGGGQRTDTRRPVRGVARVREAWAGVGAGFEPLDALLRFGWEEQQAPDAPQLEFLTELDDRRWTRRALVGQASLERSFGPVALGWTARYTHVLSTDADLNQPTAPYAAGLLLAHRPFWTGGTVALDRNRTSLQLDGGLASPVAARSWWAGWQAHAALGVHQGIRIRNSQLGFGVTGEVWSGRPGDPDPTRLDGWIAPDRAGTWAVRAGLTARY